MPCGMNNITPRRIAPNTARWICVPPNVPTNQSPSGSIMNAPRTGPHNVPRPPRMAIKTIVTLVKMLKMNCGSI